MTQDEIEMQLKTVVNHPKFNNARYSGIKSIFLSWDTNHQLVYTVICEDISFNYGSSMKFDPYAYYIY